MDYLIYDQDGELLDVLNFKNHKEYDSYKLKNPTHIILKSEDMLVEDDLFDDDLYNDLDL